MGTIRDRLAACLTLVAVTAALAPAALDGQGIAGRVVDETGSGLPDVAVTVVGTDGVRSVTGREGRFALPGLAPGSVELRFARIGYATLTATVRVDSGAPTRVAVALSPQAIELDAIDVTVRDRSLFLHGNGFYRRAERGFGRQLSRAVLDDLRLLEVADAVRNMSGIRVNRDPHMLHRVYASSPRMRGPGGAPCALTVYVDGVKTLDPNLNQVPPEWLLAMEVYLGAETPAKFRTGGSCGAVILWTEQG